VVDVGPGSADEASARLPHTVWEARRLDVPLALGVPSAGTEFCTERGRAICTRSRGLAPPAVIGRSQVDAHPGASGRPPAAAHRPQGVRRSMRNGAHRRATSSRAEGTFPQVTRGFEHQRETTSAPPDSPSCTTISDRSATPEPGHGSARDRALPCVPPFARERDVGPRWRRPGLRYRRWQPLRVEPVARRDGAHPRGRGREAGARGRGGAMYCMHGIYVTGHTNCYQCVHGRS
jgi:hypothetical protein